MRVGSLEIEIMAGIARLQKDMNDAQRIVGGSMANVERSVASAKRAMQALGVGLPLAAITDQVRRMTDQYTKLDAQLRLSTKSQAQYAQGMSDIRRISTAAQADLSATSMLYTRLMNVMQGTGVEQSKLATVTETVSFGLKAYGATAQEASSAALQLSQAMGANRLGGEEFRAVMEAMPNVMKVLADSMGVPLGALRQLSIDGKITADEMVKAFGNPAVAAEFKRLAENAQTITGAWVVARNELMLLVGEFMKSSGATGSMIAAFNGVGAAIRFMAENLGILLNALYAYVTVLGGKLIVGLVQARMAQMALSAANAANAASNVLAAEASVFAAKANLAGAAAAARAGGSMTVASAAAKEYTASLAVLAAAEKAQAAASVSIAGRIKGAVGKAGWIGMALFGIWSVVDFLDGMQAISDGAKKTAADLAGLSLQQVMLMRQKELISVLDMKGAIMGADRYRVEIRDGENRIKMFDDQIAKLVELDKAQRGKFETGIKLTHDEGVTQQRMIELSKQFSDGKLKESEYLKRVNEELYGVSAALKEHNKELKAGAKDRKELNMMREASAKYQQDIVDGIDAETEALLKKIEQERFDTEAIGKTAEQLALLQSVRYDNITALQEQKVAALEASYADEAEIAAIKEQIKARKELKGVWSTQATAQAADAQRKAWKEMWDSVDKTAHDTFVSILNGGKDTATRLKEAFKNGFFDWLYSMTLKKWIVNISGTMAGGASGAAMAGGGGGGGGWLSAAKSVYDTINGSVSAAITEGFTRLAGSSFGQNMGWSTTTTNAQGVQMQSLSDSGMLVNAGLKAIGNAAAGYMLQKTISGEYKIGNGKIVDALTLAASAYFGPIAGVVAGIVNRAFGMGPKQSGTTMLAGQFSGAGFAGQYQTPWSQKGGWFRSNKSGVDVSPVAAEQAAAFGALVQGTQSVFNDLIAISGDAAKSLAGWTFAINRQVSTEAQAQQLTIDMAEAMGQYLLPALTEFKQQGENIADTAVRMRDEFIVTNGILGLVGGSFGAVGLASMGARDNLVQLMGGIQGVSTVMQSYYQNFFTDTERHANDLRALTAQFAQLGLTIPDTATGFRLLVSSQDLSTESGRQLFAALMSLQGAFAALIPSAEQAAQAMAANIKALQDKSIADFEAARKATDSLRAFAVSVRELQRSLWAGQQTPLSNTYSVTRSQFSTINALAGAGDINAQGNLAGAATAFLDAAKLQAVSAIKYARDFAFVQNSLNDTATLTENAVTVADQQLLQLQQVNAWLAAITAYSATQSLQALVGTAASSAGSVNVAVQGQADVAAAADRAAQEAAAQIRAAQGTTSFTQYSASNPNPLHVATKRAAFMALQLAVGQGRTGEIASLQAYYDALPSFAVGTNALMTDGPIYAHAGEEVKPKAYVDADKVERAETNALLRDMRKELTLIKTHNYRMLLIQDKHDNEGMPEVRIA